MLISTLLYGGPGVVKTALASSSFWDFRTREPVEGRNGRLLLIGREENDALGIPDENIVRFPLPQDDPINFAHEFETYLRALNSAKGKEAGLTDIVIDGFTELCYDFTYAYRESLNPRDTFEVYREWQRAFIRFMQLLHPKSLNANVIGTARVAELRSGSTTSRGASVKGDPEWMDEFKYYPSMEGWARHNMGHYFNMVLYLEQDVRSAIRNGKPTKVPTHVAHLLGGGDYWTKNIFSHLWGENPATVENAVWGDVEEVIEKATAIEEILKVKGGQ